MAASGRSAAVDPFEVIFDYLLVHFGRYLGNNLADVVAPTFRIYWHRHDF